MIKSEVSVIIKIRDVHTSDKWNTDGKAPLSLDMHVPFIEDSAPSRARRRINRYYSHLSKKLKNYCRSIAGSGDAGAYCLSYTVTRDDGEALSIYCDIFRDGVLCGRLACTWDVSSGYPLPLSHFTALSRSAIINFISQSDSSCSKKRLRRFFDPDNFYVCEDCVRIYYQPMSLYRGIAVFRFEAV